MTPQEAYYKACDSRKRLPEIECIVLTDSWLSYLYSNYIIKGRWIEAEDIIMNDPHNTYYYAVNIIKGKLPEKMHNMMILHAIKNLNDFHVKEYFEFIK